MFTCMRMWSKFDDISWDEFGGGDEHSVPQPTSHQGKKITQDNKRTIECDESIKSTLQQEEGNPLPPAANADNWDSAALVKEIGEVPVPVPDGEEESADPLGAVDLCLDDQVYNDDDASVITSTCHFPFSDIPEEESLSLFSNESKVDKEEGTLLGYAWENLDMDKLFDNGDSSFGHTSDNGISLQWLSSSAASANPERAMKRKLLGHEVKMEFIPCKNLSSSHDNSKELCSSNSEGTDGHHSLDTSTASTTPQLSVGVRDAAVLGRLEERSKESKTHPSADVDKVHPSKKQALNRKRSEKKGHQKRSTEYLQHSQPIASTLHVYPPAPSMPPPMLGLSIPFQQTAQRNFPAVHSSYLQPSLLQPEHQHADSQPQQEYHHEGKEKIEGPPMSGMNMTPQEKIEKLRWMQQMQMQARETFTRQQQSSSSNSQVKSQAVSDSETSGSSSRVTLPKAEDGEMEAAVLDQLLSIMSKLEMGTRLCIRDALYRLSRSAMQRHAVDDDSENVASKPSASPHQETNIRCVVETETNSIDRTIANLLFHKQPNSALDCCVMSDSQGSWMWQDD